MTLKPKSIEDLSQNLTRANAAETRVSHVNLDAISQVKAFTPEDMTVTTETGISLADLQTRLRAGGQWLPIDPPHPEKTSISSLLDYNLSGPRRFGYGTIREHLIGLTAVLATGTVIKSGGKVVKNVAGYDLCKLFVGNHGTLGIIVEATFKLLPIPEHETFLTLQCPTLNSVDNAIRKVQAASVQPIVIDLDNLQNKSAWTLTIGFAGTRIETDWQTAEITPIGFTPVKTLEDHSNFWSETPQTLAVAPTRLIKTLAELKDRPVVARAGIGTIYFKGPPLGHQAKLPNQIMERIKEHFDPNQILPPLPW